LQRFQKEPESNKNAEPVAAPHIKQKGIIFQRKVESDIDYVRQKQFERNKSQKDEFEKRYELKLIGAYDALMKMLLGSHKNYFPFANNARPSNTSEKFKEWLESRKVNYDEIVMLSPQVFEEKIGPLLEELYRKGVITGAKDFGADVVTEPNLQLSPNSEVTDFIEQYLNRRTKLITTNLYDRLSKVLEDGLMSGASERDITKIIQKQFDIEKHRASTIVRTEMGFAYARAYHRGLTKNNMNSIWVTSLDELVRLEHLRADGQEVSPGQKYLVWGEGLEHPSDPAGSLRNIINCRCGEFAKLN
jgi:hypothetical protein